MTQITGYLRKMQAKEQTPIAYELVMHDGQTLDLNALLGKPFTISWTGEMRCIHCDRVSSKSYNQGYCYPCFRDLAVCDLCVMKPSLCHFAKGTCREPDWGLSYCMQPHVVYLSETSGVKVGITRFNHLPGRWIDQGAVQGLACFEVKSRYQSGMIEKLYSKWLSDRTNWRQMLTDYQAKADLVSIAQSVYEKAQHDWGEVSKLFPEDKVQCLWNTAEVKALHYPVIAYPEKIVSAKLIPNQPLSDKLMGIKGQYLISTSWVLNIRKHIGYACSIEF
jgi:hypothetical protein